MNLKELNNPYVILLVGVPMSGKSTWVRENISDEIIISRDRILMDVYGSDDYNKAFNNVDQGKVDKVLLKTINDSVTNRDNVVIDMTNISAKTRRRNLSYFTKDYTKIAVVFPILTGDEYSRRNDYRMVNENKSIPLGVLRNMIQSFTIPTIDEGFDKIIKL
jgi:predicted kinase